MYLLEKDDFFWAGDSDNPADLVRDIRLQKIDVAILDTQACPSCKEVCKFLSTMYPGTKIIIHSPFGQASWIPEFIQLGVAGFVSKDSSLEDMEAGIRAVVNNEVYLCPVTKASLSRPSKFTNREKEVLQLVARGFSTSDIAEKLFVSPKTVETHRMNIANKVQAKNTAELMTYVAHNGFLFE